MNSFVLEPPEVTTHEITLCNICTPPSKQVIMMLKCIR